MADAKMAESAGTPSASSVPILSVQNLEAWYGESHILHGINFQVNPGEVVTLLGRNGAGKTSTLKSVMGIIGKRSGSVRFDGKEIIRAASDRIARLGIAFCPEERGIFASLDVREKVEKDTPLLDDMLPLLVSRSTWRAPGTAVFLTSDPTRTPGAMLHNLKHNKVLHQKNLIVSVRTAQEPWTSEGQRAEIEVLTPDFTRIWLTYGYMETPNVPKALLALRPRGVQLDLMGASFFVGRRTFVCAGRVAQTGSKPWRA